MKHYSQAGGLRLRLQSALRALNPIGAARQGLKSVSGFGEIEQIAVPNFLGNVGGAAVGGAVGGATNATGSPK